MVRLLSRGAELKPQVCYHVVQGGHLLLEDKGVPAIVLVRVRLSSRNRRIMATLTAFIGLLLPDRLHSVRNRASTNLLCRTPDPYGQRIHFLEIVFLRIFLTLHGT